jgi:hypothetical protein
VSRCREDFVAMFSGRIFVMLRQRARIIATSERLGEGA